MIIWWGWRGHRPFLGLKAMARFCDAWLTKHTRDCRHTCPVPSAMFKTEEKVKVKSVVMVPQKPTKPERYSMMRDVQKEFTGAYTLMRDMQEEIAGGPSGWRMGTTSRSRNSGLKMDEGLSAFIYGHAIGFLVASEAPNRWQWGTKLTPCLQTFVCVALGIGLGPPYMPAHAIIA